MNFNITDGNKDYYNKEPEFIRLYNNPKITTRNIKKQLNLTACQYRNLRKKCLQDNTIKLRQPGRKKENNYKTHPKNYSRILRGGYTYFAVYKNNKHYCNVKKREHAEAIVKKLREVDWDKTELERIKKEVMWND